MYDFVGKRKWFFLLSAVIIIAGIIALVLGGLQLGLEFEGGSSMRLYIDKDISQGDLSSAFGELGHGDAIVQSLGDDEYFVRTDRLSNEEKEELEAGLIEKFELEEGQFETRGFDSVSPIIAREEIRYAAIAVAAAAVVILLYVTFAFRKMPSPFRYGSCAIVALLHDVCVTIAVFAIVGSILNWEVKPMFIVAVLAVIGYSVNDTIVVFDRIREHASAERYNDFRTIVNASLTQTLTRSLNTSITTLLVTLALYLFIGSDIRNFVVALLVGIIAGTYSSIFIASQLLVVWEEGKWRKYVPDVPVARRLRTGTA